MAKDKNKKPFNVLSKKGLMTLALAGVMVASPFMLAGCGEKGDKGDTGATGANGKSAYELAVDNGFTGTLQEWLDSLKGAAGAPGTPGAAGAAGAPGSSVTVVSVEKTGTNGLVDTYTITFSDGTTTNFDITNGAAGAAGASSYTHIKFANEMPDEDSDILATGTGDYIGIYNGTSETAPTNYTEYSWYKIKGDTPSIAFDGEGFIILDGVKTNICIYDAEIEQEFVYNAATYSNYEYVKKQGNALGSVDSMTPKRTSIWYPYKFKAGTTFKCVGDDVNYHYGFSISADGENFAYSTTPGLAEDTGWISSTPPSGALNLGADAGDSVVRHQFNATTKTLTLSRDSYVRINFRTPTNGAITYLTQDWEKYFEINGSILVESETVHITPDKSDEVNSYGMNSIALMGYSTEAPENTLAAVRLAHEKGFDMVSCDVSFTSDGVGVLLHDDTIDRTSDGEGNIADMTLAQVKEFDFGSWKSAAYADEEIPTFEEFIKVCKYMAIHPYIQVKSSATQANIESLVTTVFRSGMLNKVTWVSSDIDVLTAINQLNAKARLGYATETITTGQIAELKALKSETNSVFFYADNARLIVSVVDTCIAEFLPIEVYGANEVTDIENLHPYITGVASPDKVAGQILYDKYMG